jgi:hypothetical protein
MLALLFDSGLEIITTREIVDQLNAEQLEVPDQFIESDKVEVRIIVKFHFLYIAATKPEDSLILILK